jgi:hypothetical protein
MAGHTGASRADQAATGQTSRATFVPNLGALLHNLSIRASEMGRHEEALAAAETAGHAFRQLAAINRAAFEHRSAESLNACSPRTSPR